jgi:hypothetical protein
MNSTLQEVVNSLEKLSKSILDGYSGDGTFAEIWGWNCPALTRHDLANMSNSISQRLIDLNLTEIDDELEKNIDLIPYRIQVFIAQNLPYLYNGHAAGAVPTYISLIDWINTVLQPIFSWEVLQENKALPKDLARRLRSIQSELSEIVPNKDDLTKQISLINQATETAENLPTDLESLKEARTKVNSYSTEAAESIGKVKKYEGEIEQLQKLIKEKKEEADKLVSQCEEAYKITTTKGLAAAFDLRAKSLSNSMWLWVVGLLVALGIGMIIGAGRFETLNTALENKVDVGYIWIQIFLSIISFGAPIWFAWIATKQISQRFKLAEDYAFKASVAKAYEGYKSEAAKIDKDFEKRVFGSALSRLEEAPLRLMEKEHYGSPWHELLNSDKLKETLDKAPELKDKLLNLLSTKKETKVENKTVESEE